MKFHMLIYNISSEKSCMVVILLMTGIEEPTEPILRYWSNQQSWLEWTWLLLQVSDPHHKINLTEQLMLTMSMRSFQLKIQECSVFIQMLRSTILPIKVSLSSSPFSPAPAVAAAEAAVVKMPLSRKWLINSLIYSHQNSWCWTCLSKQRKEVHMWLFAYKNVREWTLSSSPSDHL